MHKEDASCRYPDFLYGEQVYIDSLARLESARIVQDAASRAGRVAEGMEGKKVVATCLQFYQSKALSEFAHARYTLIEKEKGL